MMINYRYNTIQETEWNWDKENNCLIDSEVAHPELWSGQFLHWESLHSRPAASSSARHSAATLSVTWSLLQAEQECKGTKLWWELQTLVMVVAGVLVEAVTWEIRSWQAVSSVSISFIFWLLSPRVLSSCLLRLTMVFTSDFILLM